MAEKQYDNEKRGVLFKQREKNNERSPDYTGNVTIDGKEWRLAGWIKEGRSGPFLSLSVSEPQNSSGGGGNRPARQNSDDDGFMGSPAANNRREQPARDSSRQERPKTASFDEMDDDIPF